MTRNARTRGLAALLAVLCLGLAACQKAVTSPPFKIEGRIALAAFNQPENMGELLAGGYLPDQISPVDPKVITALDVQFSETIRKRTAKSLIGPAMTRQCEEIVINRLAEKRTSALKFWLQVGQCIPADWLIVPQIIIWQEREGGDWGVVNPATVVLDFFLIDVRGGQLVRRYHFDERQQSLSDNLLNAGKFLSRGGKWVTAMDLADEAMLGAIEELGL